MAQRSLFKYSRPKLLTECTACPYRKGCVTDYVCHTTSVDNAICDGVLPMKIKDEINLIDWVYKIVILMKLKK